MKAKRYIASVIKCEGHHRELPVTVRTSSSSHRGGGLLVNRTAAQIPPRPSLALRPWGVTRLGFLVCRMALVPRAEAVGREYEMIHVYSEPQAP